MSQLWHIELDNDVGFDDGYYREWWNITNGSIRFESDDEDSAKKLCDLLNQYWISE